ncbi:YggS family pyridoxal phosphate-dependent enzyme [Cytophaga aurantiaca]|uniref:YggS family pyridoxal phosphate-dependent enzyme n=1 Tax=Cytophaga aurantiaca TaxID=29530 RepID=UPI00036339DE|nr:YggS family pyridoxal phosphate-dependent enzyme [Cytophaga aurantiaca]
MINKSVLEEIKHNLQQYNTKLIAVTKTHPVETLQEAYNIGLRVFGENKVQELVAKAEVLPSDIEWHLIGHLQSNKVKYIAPFVHMIHSVDSLKLLQEINKEAKKNNRIIKCLLQVYIAKEETKFGLDIAELTALLADPQFNELENISIEGLMGMATNTDKETIIQNEFQSLNKLFKTLSTTVHRKNINWKEVSMGMTSDYKIAIEQGSTMVRIGSAIFGGR